MGDEIAIEGEVRRPQVVDVDALVRWFPLEERVYRQQPAPSLIRRHLLQLFEGHRLVQQEAADSRPGEPGETGHATERLNWPGRVGADCVWT